MDRFLMGKPILTQMFSFSLKFLKFSISSTEWNKISLSEKEKLGLTFEEDGEFWYE